MIAATTKTPRQSRVEKKPLKATKPYNMPEQERTLWEAYESKPSSENRNCLIERYHFLVKKIANKIGEKLPGGFNIDDLVSEGTFGLIDAIKGFKREHGWRFSTYSAIRIRGSILDHLRCNDHLSRRYRLKERKVHSARESLRQELQRNPSDQELVDASGLSFDEISEAFVDRNSACHISVDSHFAFPNQEKPIPLKDKIEQLDACNEITLEDVYELLRGGNKKERLSVICYFMLGMTMKKIGQDLQLSESRVSQMMTAIKNRAINNCGIRQPPTRKKSAA